MGQKLNIKWHTFMLHGVDLLRELMESKRYFDVTLVSNDYFHFKAHKFILSACSTVLKNKLERNSGDTSIHLEGIQHEELESILQFMYLGETAFYLERKDDFLKAVRALRIKEIEKSVMFDIDQREKSSKLQGQFDEVPVVIEEKVQNEEVEEVKEVASILNKRQEIGTNHYLENDQFKHQKHSKQGFLKYRCQQGNNQANFSNHYQENFVAQVHSKLKVIKYECKLCNYKTNLLKTLKDHVNSEHGRTRHPTSEKRKYTGNKGRTVRKIAENVFKYHCQECKYKTNNKHNIFTHAYSKHGVVYPCQQCDHIAPNKSKLQSHVLFKHNGIKRYLCQHCDYYAFEASILQKHVIYKHMIN